MKKFLFAAIAALTLSASVGSAFAAAVGDGANTNSSLSYGTWVNNKPPAFVYNQGS
jgi:hypothetical protein